MSRDWAEPRLALPAAAVLALSMASITWLRPWATAPQHSTDALPASVLGLGFALLWPSLVQLHLWTGERGVVAVLALGLAATGMAWLWALRQAAADLRQPLPLGRRAKGP